MRSPLDRSESARQYFTLRYGCFVAHLFIFCVGQYHFMS